MYKQLRSALLSAAVVGTVFWAPQAFAESTYNWYEYLSMQGRAELRFSGTFDGARRSIGIHTEALSPSSLQTPSPRVALWTMPVADAYYIDEGPYGLKAAHVTHGGGIRFSTPEDPEGFASVGGWLEIRSVDVDFSSGQIFADISGAHGVSPATRVAIWRFGSVTGSTDLTDPQGQRTNTATITGLSLTSDAFDRFSQALGLTEAGVYVFGTAGTHGQLVLTQTSWAPLSRPTDPTFRTNVHVTSVPKSGTWMLTALGLAALSMVAKRRGAEARG